MAMGMIPRWSELKADQKVFADHAAMANALSSAAAVGGRLRRIVSPNGLIYLHHCCSHGTPSLFPSIFVPGQFLRKKVASSQEVI